MNSKEPNAEMNEAQEKGHLDRRAIVYAVVDTLQFEELIHRRTDSSEQTRPT